MSDPTTLVPIGAPLDKSVAHVGVDGALAGKFILRSGPAAAVAAAAAGRSWR